MIHIKNFLLVMSLLSINAPMFSYALVCGTIGNSSSAIGCDGKSVGYSSCIGGDNNYTCVVSDASPPPTSEGIVVCGCLPVEVTLLSDEIEVSDELIDAYELTCEQPNDVYERTFQIKDTSELVIEVGSEIGVDLDVVSAKVNAKLGIKIGEERTVSVTVRITPRKCKDTAFKLYKKYRKVTYKITKGEGENSEELIVSARKLLESPKVIYDVKQNENCCPLIVDLVSFQASLPQQRQGINLDWVTATEEKNMGFRLWRALGNQDGSYKDITMLKEFSPNEIFTSNRLECTKEIRGELINNDTSKPSDLIWSVGDSKNGTCYSFIDKSVKEKEGTYYYLLEDNEVNGDRTFHCDEIVAATIGQGASIDLENAKQYCWSITEEN